MYVFLISLIKLFLNMYMYICLVSITFVHNLFIIVYYFCNFLSPAEQEEPQFEMDIWRGADRHLHTRDTR